VRNDVTANGQAVVRRRLATYAVVLREDQVLLTQLSQRTGWPGLWTLPGGGVDHGEDPRYALLREVMEETGQLATLGRVLDVNAEHSIGANPQGVVENYQAVRLFFEATVPVDAPPPRVLEVDGSTAAAAWHLVDDVVEGRVPVVPVVRIGLAALDAAERPARTPVARTHQRLAAYAVVLRGDAVLLTRISSSGHHVGSWTLPGGGVEHGEDPRAAAVREVAEETGLAVVAGRLLDVHAVHFTGRAPDGELEDFHGVHLIFQGTMIGTRSIQVTEDGGTTDAADWVPIASVRAGSVPVLDVVRAALDAADVG
jgi:ADP-ribose pyrophosphatase YjhB (NUDIX family)